MIWQLPDTYHSAGHGRGTATLKFHEGRDILLITFAGSLCCALSIAQFARRVPSAGWSYTYNSRGLGQTAGFLTGWMMVFGCAAFVPGGVALTSTYASILVAGEGHVTIAPWVLFPVILAAVALLAYLGIRISSSAELLLVAGEMAVIAALAITILVKLAAASAPSLPPTGCLLTTPSHCWPPVG